MHRDNTPSRAPSPPTASPEVCRLVRRLDHLGWPVSALLGGLPSQDGLVEPFDDLSLRVVSRCLTNWIEAIERGEGAEAEHGGEGALERIRAERQLAAETMRALHLQLTASAGEEARQPAR
jgi:hypothetical protein